MKKLLTFLASFTLIASSSSIVVACTGDEYSINYKNNGGKLEILLEINEEKLKTYSNSKELYDELMAELPDNSIEIQNQQEVIENQKTNYIVTSYSITVLNASGKPALNQDESIDFGKTGDRRYIKVEYQKDVVYGELNDEGTSFKEGSQVIEVLEEDFASFAMINK